MDVEVGLVISYQPGGNSSGGLWSPVQKESCRGLCGEKLTFMLGGDAGSGSVRSPGKLKELGVGVLPFTGPSSSV